MSKELEKIRKSQKQFENTMYSRRTFSLSSARRLPYIASVGGLALAVYFGLDYATKPASGSYASESPSSQIVFPNSEIPSNQRVERMEQLLQKYNSPLANQNLAQFMYEKEIQYNVKLEVVGAIIYADTSLATNLTTPFNVGNVGNTDSCPTCQNYGSWQEGLEAVFAVLNNDALSSKQYLYELSCGGYIKKGQSCQSPIYASSKFNWNNNTTIFLAEFFNDNNQDNYLDYPIRN